MDTEVCFNCGNEYRSQGACPKCGYKYSIEDKCPRLTFGNICSSTHKFCVHCNQDYLGCEILINNN